MFYSGNNTRVKCLDFQDVNLSHNHLTSAPDDLFYFPSLAVLDLSYNAISVLPFAMWQAPSLKDLNLSHNVIESLPIRSERALPFAERSQSQIERLNSEASSSDMEASGKSADVILQPVHRKNLWNSRLFEETIKSTETRMDKNESALKVLNLSFNSFASAPLGLCCLAPNLAKLILASNCLRSMGIIQDYPAGLKHLDVSSNNLEESLRPGTADEMDSVCFFEDSSWQKGKRIGE